MPRLRWQRLLTGLLWCVLGVTILCPTAHADGIYMPPKAFKKMPEIPAQRAVLTWRDGMERMVVESTFKGEGDRFGWVIPLPAEPKSFEAVSPGFLKTLAFNTQPTIEHDELLSSPNGFLVLLAIVLGLLALIAYARGGMRPSLFMFLLLTMLFLGFLGGFKFWFDSAPKFEGMGTGSKGIKVEKQARIGSYAVEVVRAETPEALGGWLEQNGFAALPAEGKRIVKDLIEEKWHFVTARLQRDGGGLCRPHPMAITFPASQLIYPMRMTALAETPVYLELYTIADRQTSSKRLKTEFCDRFAPIDENYNGTYVHAYAPKNRHSNIGHPDAQREMWPGCVVTRLSGTFKPRQMRSDIKLDWKEPDSYRRTYYTRSWVGAIALMGGLMIWCVGMLIIMLALTEERSGQTESNPIGHPVRSKYELVFIRLFWLMFTAGLVAFICGPLIYLLAGIMGDACLIFAVLLPIVVFWLSGKLLRKAELTNSSPQTDKPQAESSLKRPGFRVALRRAVSRVTLGAIALGGVVYLLPPKTDAIVKNGDKMGMYFYEGMDLSNVRSFVGEVAKEHPTEGIAELRKALTKEISLGRASKWDRWLEESPTGEPLKEEDSPGNYVLFENGAFLGLKVYGWQGFPSIDKEFIPLPSARVTTGTTVRRGSKVTSGSK